MNIETVFTKVEQVQEEMPPYIPWEIGASLLQDQILAPQPVSINEEQEQEAQEQEKQQQTQPPAHRQYNKVMTLALRRIIYNTTKNISARTQSPAMPVIFNQLR